MISQQFKLESPIANYVMVAGKFQYPLNDDICRGVGWSNFVSPNTNGLWEMFMQFPSTNTIQRGLDSATKVGLMLSGNTDNEFNVPCINLIGTVPATITPLDSRIIIYTYPIKDIEGSNIDLTKLIGMATTPTISFLFKEGKDTSQYELRLYLEDPNNKGHPKIDCYYACQFAATNTQDHWGEIEIALPNTIYKKEYGDWSIQTVSPLFAFVTASIDWGDLNKVAYIGFSYKTQADLTSTGASYCRIKRLSINGTVIRAAYDSINMATYGTRMLTVKDSFAQTDSLSAEVDNTPLALEAIYDLQRYRKTYLTGSIRLLLDPNYLAGQRIWIQAEDVIPVGATIHTQPSYPTTTTIGNLGDYYVNTSSSSPMGTIISNGVFRLTAITGGVYTWTNLGMVRYKINQTMRITKVTHNYSSKGAYTTLTLTSDLTSSLSVDTKDNYTVLMRAVTPDFQSKTFGSLKSDNSFDLGLPIISRDYKDITV
jgi:hypothetical protein